MTRRRGESLESWLLWLRDELSARGVAAQLRYEDRLAGDVIVRAVGASAAATLVELTTTRRLRGQAYLAVLATTGASVAALAPHVDAAHARVPRLANVQRKFVHRFARMLDELARSWATRVAAPAAARDQALAQLRATAPEAQPMCGLGFHTDLAGADDRHTRAPYPTLVGAAIAVGSSWRALPWDPARATWAVSAGAGAALGAAHAPAALAAAGVTVAAAAALPAAWIVGSELVDEPPAADAPARRACDLGSCDVGPCDLADLASLGDLIPDCDVVDCGSLDCAPDCSL